MAQLVVPGQTPKYTGTLQCISKVYQEEVCIMNVLSATI